MMSEIASSNAQVNIADVNEAGDVILRNPVIPEYEEEKEEQVYQLPPFNYVSGSTTIQTTALPAKRDVFAIMPDSMKWAMRSSTPRGSAGRAR
jgi:hypothetical protein